MSVRLGWFIPRSRSLTDYNRVLASVWIRCLQLIEPFRVMGYDSVVNRPLAPMDIAIFLRVQGKWMQWLQRLLKRRGVRTVFVVGVNYYEREGNVEGIRDSVRDSQIRDCIAMSRDADVVVTASRFLMERAKGHNSDVVYIPDSVTREHFQFTKTATDFDRTPLTLVWGGHSVKAHFIDEVYRVVADLPVKLVVISEYPPDLEAPFTFVRWRYESFAHEIVRGDVCISPRSLDNSYDQGHSNFKIMVFLTQGVPALVSPQDSYVEVIRDGYNGFVCPTPQDWRRRLVELLGNRDLLRTMSANAIESSHPYLTRSVLSSYDVVFRSLLASQRVSGRKG